jgi:hypothetical protein
MAATSRATPTWLSQSGRFGVTSTSSTVSWNPYRSSAGVPFGTGVSSSMIPEPSSPSPSSVAEQIMPQLSTPRIFDFLIWKSPGSCAPTRAKRTVRPARTFGAPQTTCTGSPVPSSTLHRLSRSASGCFSRSSTRATTTPGKARLIVSMPSTLRPAAVRRAASCAGSSSQVTKSRSQSRLIFTAHLGTGSGSAGRSRTAGGCR